jgi:hypothetical protein
LDFGTPHLGKGRASTQTRRLCLALGEEPGDVRGELLRIPEISVLIYFVSCSFYGAIRLL